jgi:heat-inducible transcriptional repressor
MDERKKSVLQAIIQDYIDTAEPVGSRTIARKYNLGVSPATIRNEMADLEELGLIEQPHTSAGRIPSDLGYRYYVDFIMKKEEIEEAVNDQIKDIFNQKIEDIESVIKTATDLLSEATTYTAMTLGPNLGKTVLRQVQLMPLSENTAMVIAVTHANLVQHYMIRVPEGVNTKDLFRINMVLNQSLSGYSFDQVKQDTLQDIYRELTGFQGIIHDILEQLEQGQKDNHLDRVYMGGTLNIFNQPDFKNVDKIKDILSTFEKENVLRDLLSKSKEQGIVISIGGENKYEGIAGCSIITAKYKVNDKMVGSIGIIGPTRMAYSKAISLVECVTINLSEALGKFLK